MMELMDNAPSGKLCVAYQKYSSVEAVDEITGETQKIYNVDSVKVYRLLVCIIVMHAN